MISRSQAQEIIQHKAPKMPIVSLPLDKVCGYILAEDIIASSDLPPFNNSAMDGYALKAEWVKDASESNPISLKAQGEILAGHKDDYTKDTAVAIMTGAKVPDYYDAVIPIEMIEKDGDNIIVKTTRRQGENIRNKASDLCKGDILITKGTLLNPYHISLMGAQAIRQVSIFQKPRIAVIITGDEIGDDNDENSQIADANGPFLKAAIAQYGGELVAFYHMSDDEAAFAKLIQRLKGKVDLIISTGAVSAGVKDFIPSEILAEGGQIHFHKVYQRPGKPLLFAELSDGTAWFGLPGNPVAVQASFIFSLTTWLNTALQTKTTPLDYAVLKGNYTKKSDFCIFLRGNCYTDKKGQLCVELSNQQASYQLKNWGKVNCWIEAPAGIEEFNDNDVVQILRINP
ncbi:MAG: molybdopterin molybdotransferase MoeA [Alphaproteobacteria bacterium]